MFHKIKAKIWQKESKIKIYIIVKMKKIFIKWMKVDKMINPRKYSIIFKKTIIIL